MAVRQQHAGAAGESSSGPGLGKRAFQDMKAVRVLDTGPQGHLLEASRGS